MELRNDKRVLTEGIAAYELGLSYTRCPYESDTSEYVTWIAGWSYADRWADHRDYLDPPPEWFERIRYSVLKGVNTAELAFTE